MIGKEDNTFNETREKSVLQWLDELKGHEDLVVRDGVRVTTDYIYALKKRIKQLEETNELKDTFLKKLKKEKMDLMGK
ncbi:putative uncharacterized protein [Clostridium sp. CAG:411]|jgi:hypothetical protein|nr:hypothetical protein [Lachnospiraceae bacterium]CDE44675.1 putative uncharacterized protein [Clostridium sp. CAG:411]